MISADRRNKLLPGIHGLRFLAAASVVIFHLYGLAHIAPDAVAAITNYGAHAVWLFFLLSAFSLMYATVPTQSAPNWIAKYCIRRFFRIAPLFYALILPSVYFQYWALGVPVALDRSSLNLTFLFNFIPGQMPSMVQAGWTIGVEMVFYALMPIIIGTVRGFLSSAVFLVVSIVVGQYVTTGNVGSEQPWWVVHMNFPINLQWFAAGVFAYFVFEWVQAAVASKRLVAAVAFGVCLVTGYVVVSSPNGLTYNLGLLAFFSSLCVWQAFSPSRLLANKMTNYIGERSYSIYLVHTPIMIALWPIYAWLLPRLGQALTYVVGGAITILATLAVAEVTYRLIERPGITLGRALISRRISPLNTSVSPT